MISPRSLPEGTPTAGAIVCERTGRWAAGLRRELAAAECRIHEARTLSECRAMVAEHPASFLVIELSRTSAGAVLEHVSSCQRQYPAGRVAVVADRSLRAYEWLIREAGAVHFVTSPRELGPLAGIIRRHLAQVPEPRRSITERIWSSLPWGRAGQSVDL